MKQFIKFLIESETRLSLIGNKDIVSQMNQKLTPTSSKSKRESIITATSTPKQKNGKERIVSAQY